MKRVVFLMALLLAISGVAAKAQTYMVVDSEKIFKSIEEYSKALEEIEKLGEQYQKQVDTAFATVEQMFNEYQSQKERMSQTTRNEKENAIIENEKKINDYQQRVFGQDGELMKQRLEKIKPIQDRVFKAIENYAIKEGFELVIDITANPTVLYYAPGADRTEKVIEILKSKK